MEDNKKNEASAVTKGKAEKVGTNPASVLKHDKYSDIKGLQKRDRNVISMMFPDQAHTIEDWDKMLANIVNFK